MKNKTIIRILTYLLYGWFMPAIILSSFILFVVEQNLWRFLYLFLSGLAAYIHYKDLRAKP